VPHAAQEVPGECLDETARAATAFLGRDSLPAVSPGRQAVAFDYTRSVPASPVHIRSYEPRDHEAVRHLYTDGLLGGTIAENDTGFDIEDVELAYMRTAGSHFWVAENEEGAIVGMIGLQQLDAGVGEIRRLRVSTEHRRRGIGSQLLQRALEFCRDEGLLKVTLDTYIEREPALKLFEKFNFRHDKTRETGGKQLLFFYLDLYGSDRTKEEE